MKVIVIGDVHGEFNKLNAFLNKPKNIDIILQCGDFGYWPKSGIILFAKETNPT